MVTLGGPKASPAAGVLNNYIVVAKANQSQSLTASTSGAEIQSEQTQVQEEIQGLQLQAYPNPVPGDKVHVALKSQSGKEAVSITMYDASGKVIKSKTLITDNNGIGSTEIPVRGINRGFYIIKAQSISGNKQLQVLIE